MLTLGSLFDGIGGFCLAGQMNGIKPIWSSEIEKFCLKVTEARFPDVKQLGSVTDINGAEIEPVDIITFGSPCFPAGTLVNTDAGYKPIEDVRVTDRVLTHNGIYRQVLDSRYTGTKQVMRLKAMGVHTIEATPNHLFLIRKDRNQGIAEWKRLDELQKGYLLAIPIIQAEENPLSLTDEECWLIGRYIADGYVRVGQRPDRPNGSEYASVVFCIGKGKEDTFESHLKYYKAGKSKNEGNVFKYTISSHRLTQICEACGVHAMNKHLPTFVLNLPRNMLKTVIEGYMSGDGCAVDGLFKATSISETLVYSLGQAVLKVYRVPYRIYKNEVQSTTTIQGRVVNQHAQWQLVFKTDARKRDKAFCEGEYAWLPVRKIETVNERKAVYDLTVEKDHSFCVVNVAVHNCQDLSVAGKQLGIHEGQRSNLFFEAIRIIKEMRKADEARGRSGKSIRPRFAVWENVPGAFSSNKGEDFRAVLEAFANVCENDISISRPKKWDSGGEMVGNGWSVAWRVYDAQYWGVPQRRKRIYLVADFADERAGEILFVEQSMSGHFTESGAAREGTAADAERSVGRSGGVRCLNPWDCQTKRQYDINGCYATLNANSGGGGRCDGVVYEPKSLLDENWAEQDVKNALRANASKSGHAVVYAMDAVSSNSMKSKNPYSGFHEEEIARTLDTRPDPTCNQGGNVIVEPVGSFMGGQGAKAGGIAYSDDGTTPTLKASPSGGNTVPDVVYALQGNGIDRADTAGCNGKGWRTDEMYTLNTIDRPAVCYGVDCRNATLDEEKTHTLQAKASKS